MRRKQPRPPPTDSFMLDCYWVGSLDFNFVGNTGVFLNPKKVKQLGRQTAKLQSCIPDGGLTLKASRLGLGLGFFCTSC